MPSSTIYTANQAALSTTANLLSGDVNEFIPYPAVVNIFSVASAIGVRMTLSADSDILIDDKEIPNIGTTLLNDHKLDSFEIEEGSRLSVRLRETANVATTDTYVKVEIIPI